MHPAPGNYHRHARERAAVPLRQPSFSGRSAGRTERERAGIVHRLDKDTSGVMVVARTPGGASLPVGAVQGPRRCRKRYLALVAGVIKKGSGTHRGRPRQARARNGKRSACIRTRRARRSPCTGSRSVSRTQRWSRSRSRPAERIRSVCTWRISATPCSATASTAAPGRQNRGEESLPRQMLHAASLSLFHPGNRPPHDLQRPAAAGYGRGHRTPERQEAAGR